MAKGTFGIRLAIGAFTLELKLLVEQIEFIEEQVNVLEETIEQILDEYRTDPEQPYRHVIETIPGIGPVLAAAIIGEIDAITCFPNAKALVAYASLDATFKASG